MGYKKPYRLFFYSVLVLFFSLSQIDNSMAQKRYESKSRKQNKWRYKKAIVKPGIICKLIEKNKKRSPRKRPHIVISKKQTYAEGGAPSFNPYKNDPTTSSTTYHVKEVIPIESLNIDEKHAVEDEVLKKNHLPEPTSEKHEQIRRDVEKHLANFENESPLKLEPLYFVVNQDEFAFVDMEPFLIAVEYALQGKHLLIEGHTDDSGHSELNVQLSIKRVERIRQLMLDMGVSDNNISVVGYGEEHAETNDALATDKQLDRRVDFTVF
jgi:flagellar motor protein MotB